MERIREIPCPENNEECKYYPNCHLSKHHEIHRDYVKRQIEERPGDAEYARTAHRYMNDPRFIIISCRMIHDLLDKLPTKELPTLGEMKRRLGLNTEDFMEGQE